MLDPINPAKCLLFFGLMLISLCLGVRITRRFLGVQEPLDIFGFALGVAMLVVGVVGSWIARLTRSFPVTFILLAGIMALPWLWDWRRQLDRVSALRSSLSFRFFPGDLRDRTEMLTRRERYLALVLGVVALLPPLNLIWRTHLWDDWYFYLPLTSAFSRGVFPVVYPFLPDRALTYHFGFAWLAGIVEYHTGISPEHCVDIVSTAMLVTFYFSSAATFRIWLGGRLAPYAAAAIAIGFGPLAWFWSLVQNGFGGSLTWLWGWISESQTTFSTEVARPADYLLQKPMLAGMALVWVVMALFFVARRRTSVAGAAASGIAAGMLELFQYPMASLALVAGMGVLFLDLVLQRIVWKRRLAMLLCFGATAVILPRLNGGFVANPQGDPIFVDRIWNFPYPAFVDFGRTHSLPTFVCYLLYYGASAVVLPFVLPHLWRRKSMNALWMLAVFGAAFAVPHLMRHRSSPVNITKFFQISAFALAALSAAGVLAATSRWPSRVRAFALCTYLIVVNLSTWFSSIHISTPPSTGVVASSTVASLRRMARWLRPHAGVYDRVFALTDEVEAMSGVLSPLPPFAEGGRQLYTVTAHGYAPDYIASIKSSTDSLAASLDEASLLRLKIRWIVLPDPLPDVVGTEARRRLEQTDSFQLRERISPNPGSGWRIYEYLKGPLPGSLED